MTTPPAASAAMIHLGGDAYALAELAPLLCPATEFRPHPENPRRGDVSAIAASIRDHGLYLPLTRQTSTGYVLRGNHTGRALLELGAERIPFVNKDCDDTEARVIVARDNRLSDLGGYDPEAHLSLLSELQDAGRLNQSGYDDAYLADLAASLGGLEPVGPEYTRRTDAIHYQPTMPDPPPVGSLVDSRKADGLAEDILRAALPDDVRRFLLLGARRHLVFDYALIAEFYAHATPDVQRLMEASALVIVDFEDAIDHGYVRLSSRLSELLGLDTQAREDLDAEAAAGA